MANFKWWENYDVSVKINHNRNCPYIPDHPCRILIIGGFGSGKTNVLLNLKNNNKILTKCIYMSKIHSNQSTNWLSVEGKSEEMLRKVLMFDDMVADMESCQHFTCFYIAVYPKNTQQKRTSTNSIESFIW